MVRVIEVLAAAAFIFVALAFLPDWKKTEAALPAECNVPGATWADCRNAIDAAEAELIEEAKGLMRR